MTTAEKESYRFCVVIFFIGIAWPGGQRGHAHSVVIISNHQSCPSAKIVM